MKTAEQKAVEDFEYYINQFHDGEHPENINKDDFVNFIIAIRKRQDRDTRHACAEAVINPAIGDRDQAHNACMNVKAV